MKLPLDAGDITDWNYLDADDDADTGLFYINCILISVQWSLGIELYCMFGNH
jgi:hypothetical protein